MGPSAAEKQTFAALALAELRNCRRKELRIENRPRLMGLRSADMDTSELAGGTLDQLLEAAEDDCWPNN